MPSSTPPRPQVPGEDAAREITRMADRLIVERKTPGYACGVFDPSGILMFASRSTLPGEPSYDEHTRFRIASMSKSFTAAAIMRLAWLHRLDLHDPVRRHVPEFSVIADEVGSAVMGMANAHGTRNRHAVDEFDITIADLLSMRSGLPTDDAWADRQESMTEHDFLSLLRRGVRAAFAPGECYQYSNIGFAVLGQIIVNLTGSTVDEYVSRSLLDPLGLGETTYDYRRVDPAALALGHHITAEARGWDPEDFTTPGAFSAIGGVISSVHDVVRWARWLEEPLLGADGAPFPHAADGDFPGSVLPPRYRRLMQRGHTPVPPVIRGGSGGNRMTRRDFSELESYGYGLMIDHNPRYGDITHHAGGYPGYGSDMRWHQDSGLGVVILANGRYAEPSIIGSRILSLLLDDAQARRHTIAGRSVRLWRETGAAARRVTRMLRSLGGCPRIDAAACRQALQSIADLFADNMGMDSSMTHRSASLAGLLREAGRPIADPRAGQPCDGPADSPEAEFLNPRSDGPANISWTVPCERAGIRCALRLTPLRPSLVQTLEFTTASTPDADGVTSVTPTVRPVCD